MKTNQYLIKSGDFEFRLNSEMADGFDVIKISEGEFHIIHEQTSYKAEIINFDFTNKALTIKVNGNKYPILIQDHFDMLVDKMGLSIASANVVKDIKAPMPGLVLDIEVESGQLVEKGDALLILEAMKMENVLKSLGEGVVKEVLVNKGDAVEKGQVLIEME